MSTIVANRGNQERDADGRVTTNETATFGDQGTVRVVYQGIEYVFGPGELKAFADDGIAAGVIAADSRLVAADSRHGMPKVTGNTSLSTYRF